METSCYGKYPNDLQWFQKHPKGGFSGREILTHRPRTRPYQTPELRPGPIPRTIPDFVFLTSAEVLDVSGAASKLSVFCQVVRL